MQNQLELQVLASFLSDNLITELYIHNTTVLHTLEDKDFENQAYRHIFNIYKYLLDNNYDLEHALVSSKLNKKAQVAFIEVITTVAVSNVEVYIKMLKENKAKRELRLQATKLLNQDDDVDLVKTAEAISKLQDIKSSTTTKKFDLSFLKNKTLSSADIEKANFDYIFDNLIVKAELTMIAAKPGSGKSLTTVALCNHALQSKKVDTVIYFDLDNSTTTLKQRGLNNLLNIYSDSFVYLHSSKITKVETFRYIKQFQNMDLTNKLFIFDSAKNFMQGGDRDKNKDVSKLTDMFKILRDKGATVIFLHHTNKPSKDLEELIYSGSSAWEEDTTNAYLLTQNLNKNAFIFKNFKARVGDMQDLAFKYNDNHTLTALDYDDAIETEEDEEIKDEIISYLKDNNMEPLKRCYTQILFTILKIGYAKNKVASVMKRNIDKYWTAIKQTQNNRTVYTNINNPVKSNEPQITTFEYQDSKKSQKISIDLNKTMDKCDKSDKSILKDLSQIGSFETSRISGNANIDIPFIA